MRSASGRAVDAAAASQRTSATASPAAPSGRVLSARRHSKRAQSPLQSVCCSSQMDCGLQMCLDDGLTWPRSSISSPRIVGWVMTAAMTAHPSLMPYGDLATGQVAACNCISPCRSRYYQRAIPAGLRTTSWDNTAMDSFFSSLKTQLTARKLDRTRDMRRRLST
jgi:hypothetical protein